MKVGGGIVNLRVRDIVNMSLFNLKEGVLLRPKEAQEARKERRRFRLGVHMKEGEHIKKAQEIQ